MRIAHVVHNYLPEFRGGIELTVSRSAAGQRRAGHDVLVLCGTERTATEAHSEYTEHEGIRVIRLLRGPGLRDHVDPFRADLVPLYESAIASFAPHVVHVHHWLNLGDDLVRRAVRLGARGIVTLYDFYTTCALCFRVDAESAPCRRGQSEANCTPCIGTRFGTDGAEVAFRVGTRLRSFCAELEAASVVMAPSRSHARALTSLMPGCPEITVVPLGSDAVGPRPRTPREGRLRVLHFGNLCRLKGVAFLMDAARLADPGSDLIELRLAGGLVDAGLDLGDVWQYGPYDATRLQAIAAECDLAVFPSLAAESYSLVVDEALRAGLPVLVSDRGAMPERLGERGWVLPAGDLGAWSAALRLLACDRGRLASLAQGRGPDLTSWDDHCAANLANYEAALRAERRVVSLEPTLLRRVRHLELALGHLAERAQRST